MTMQSEAAGRAAQDAARALRALIPAERVLTEGPGYAAAVALWNAAVVRRPAVVVRCADVADVQAGVRTAREFGLPLTVRGGGHDWAGSALRDGGLTLDLSGMRDVRVDPERRHAVVGGGATAGDVLAAAEPFGLVAATGTIGSVGIVGLTLGGGYGPLAGRAGLAADNLVGAEVVLADGSVVDTDAEHEPDLFWALRGGGGNFGVVVSARIRLHAVPSVVTGVVLYPRTQAEQVFGGLREALAASPDELTVQSAVGAGPDGEPAVMVLPTWSGAADADDAPLQALTRLGTPLAVQLDSGPLAAAIAAREAMFPPGRHITMGTRSVRELTPEVVAALTQHGAALPSPLSALSLHHFHGAAARIPASATAFAAREPHLMVELIAVRTDAAGGEAHRRWIESASAALAPYALPGGYPNLLGPDDTAQTAHAYGPNTARLLKLKSTIDPDAVFSAIPLPTTTP
ncbi:MULTISPECIES: FAD-binding oxidoreductase [Actinomadura]|uniref:FAD-binding oxidoreductase n=1 Tax=Actinomadura yumaensis TaxID=111807 RepID=A0ABW2CJH5_9ACTN|nr:FAD-dependent oxidoreductase [Actinomadura sp. J1-007]